MRTISIMSRKGGSGKTTLTVHMAINAYLRGENVLAADIDPQASSADVFKARKVEGPGWTTSTGSKLFALQTSSVRAGVSRLVIDTPPQNEDEILQAVVLSDLVVLVVRPTFLDLAAAVRSASIIRQLNRKGLIVINQAPVGREGIEPPQVVRAMQALPLLNLPIAPVIIRSRTAYQTGLATGRSAEEFDPKSIAATEMAELLAYIDTLLKP